MADSYMIDSFSIFFIFYFDGSYISINFLYFTYYVDGSLIIHYYIFCVPKSQMLDVRGSYSKSLQLKQK